MDSGAADWAVRRAEIVRQSEDPGDDGGARCRTAPSPPGHHGAGVRRAVCRTGHDEARVHSRVLLLRRGHRDRTVARRVEGQSFPPDRAVVDRRVTPRPFDLFLRTLLMQVGIDRLISCAIQLDGEMAYWRAQ